MITYAKEKFSEKLILELKVLTNRHWEEVGDKRFPINIDWNRYVQFDESGFLRTFTARDEGELIAYNIFLAAYHPHRKDSLVANHDTIYCIPEYRKLGVGGGIIDHATGELLREEGMSAVSIGVKERHDFSPTLLKRGFELNEKIYIKFSGD